ncbi:hypothetical protein SS1G_02604 [Sclerotinia sclerotiorum 1980 UF-70]|uniref:DUF427 domain-containing protein n=1 Tax=Sclerotinia sclerotiorum (strain ATCC 18683 / 1980 / Ss-1) TaxID=665079 RepID=A7EBB8_SCLS1|nr:hypothetical protein SS1G_02604 [Sclerotinia sclerotiorum 1980 UF-70]EDN99746.1 hypothetical protein SS1G_02604 [Sclerotinia sclerotiorum 1980 UF-70]
MPSLNQALLSKTDHSTHCPWKGDASYYTITFDKTELKNAAWYYPTPFEKAQNIKDYVAFSYFRPSMAFSYFARKRIICSAPIPQHNAKQHGGRVCGISPIFSTGSCAVNLRTKQTVTNF